MILPVSGTSVDRESFLVKGTAGHIVMLLFYLRTSNLPVQPVKVQPFLTATTSASFLQSSLLQGGGVNTNKVEVVALYFSAQLLFYYSTILLDEWE